MCDVKPEVEKPDEYYTESKYNSRILVGNWNEEVFRRDHHIREFLNKRESGDLLIQKMEKMRSIFLREMQLGEPCEFIRFGTVVQLIASCYNMSEPLALSISATEKTIKDNLLHISNECQVTVAPSPKPCVRNTFIITSADQVNRTNQFLLYGQDFYLQCVECDIAPMLLYSAPKTSTLFNVSDTAFQYHSNIGDINQCVGVCYQSDSICNQTDAKPHIPRTYCRFRVLHLKRRMRDDTEGEPVPVNTRVIINNSQSNRNLSTEHSWIDTVFGKELGSSCTTYLNPNGVELSQNIWQFSITSPDFQPST